MIKRYYYFGIGFIILYFLTTKVGELLVYSNYNTLIDVVSAFPLYMSKQNFIFIYASFILANLFLILFCLYSIKSIKKTKYQNFKISFILIIIQTIISSLIYIFPMSKREDPLTFSGFIHIALFSTCIALIILSIYLLIKACYKLKLKKYFFIFLILIILTIIFTILSTLGALSLLKYFGLYQRILIDIFLIYIFILSIIIKKITFSNNL